MGVKPRITKEKRTVKILQRRDATMARCFINLVSSSFRILIPDIASHRCDMSIMNY